MKKQPDDAAVEIPEIPASARLKKSRLDVPANAMMPKRKVTLALEADLIAWFEAEARQGGLTSTEHINKALRKYIVDLVADKSSEPTSSLSARQRDEVKKLINESLRRKGLNRLATL